MNEQLKAQLTEELAREEREMKRILDIQGELHDQGQALYARQRAIFSENIACCNRIDALKVLLGLKEPE